MIYPPRYRPRDWQRRFGLINCSKCGRFVGKDGDPDVFYDDYNGGWEIGYPLCGRCLREKQARRQQHGGEER